MVASGDWRSRVVRVCGNKELWHLACEDGLVGWRDMEKSADLGIAVV